MNAANMSASLSASASASADANAEAPAAAEGAVDANASTSAMPMPRPRVRSTPRWLVVHDDAAIRLKLAEVLGRHYTDGRIDTCGSAAATSIGPAVPDYSAVIVVADFAVTTAIDPLALVAKLRRAVRGRAVVVVGRNGDERAVVRAMRAGASDYWSMHKLDAVALVRELTTVKTESGSAPPSRIAINIPGFKILKELERSTGSTLLLVESAESVEPLALKVHQHLTATDRSTTERERFQRECELLSKFNDRGVADVHGFGVTDDFHWLAMEYFPCGSLKARLQNPVTEQEALSYLTSITRALASIHAASIVHRDLKPSNIMLRPDDSVALIDFGLARPATAGSTVTAPNIRVGSPLYMSPEQIEGMPPDARCDLYALGVIFHELLTGRVPYTGETIASVLAQHRLTATPRLPENLARHQSLLDRLMAKSPDDRVASAAAVLEALAALHAGSKPSGRSA